MNSVIQVNQKHVGKTPLTGHRKSGTKGKLINAQRLCCAGIQHQFSKRLQREGIYFKAHATLPNRTVLDANEVKHKRPKPGINLKWRTQ
jgi:hypothetical protein